MALGIDFEVFLCSKSLDVLFFDWKKLPIQKEDPITTLCAEDQFTEKSMIFRQIAGPSHTFFNAISKQIELESSAWS